MLDAIGKGEASDVSLEKVYGKSIEAIQRDLQAYVHGDHFLEGVIHAKLAKPDVDPVVVPSDPLQIEVLLAAIQSHGNRRDQALETLENLAKANPGNPLPLDSWLGSISPVRIRNQRFPPSTARSKRARATPIFASITR